MMASIFDKLKLNDKEKDWIWSNIMSMNPEDGGFPMDQKVIKSIQKKMSKILNW